MTKPITSLVENKQLKQEQSLVRPGDRVIVHVRIIEGESERTQLFEGLVISQSGSSVKQTITVRKISYGIGVERIFPIHSPRVTKIEIIQKGKVRRAKLFYLRKRVGKAALKVKIKHQSSQSNSKLTKPSVQQ